MSTSRWLLLATVVALAMWHFGIFTAIAYLAECHFIGGCC